MMLDARARVSRIPRKRRARCGSSTRRRTTTTASGYQDVQNRVPKIDNTCADLDWEPTRRRWTTRCARIFDAYRGQVAEARALVEWRRRRTVLPRAQGRRRHAARHARGRARRSSSCCSRHGAARRSCSRSGPTTPGARSGACSGQASSARCGARRSCGTTACARCCTARCCPGPDIGRRAGDVHARVARRGLRDRHPLLGPRPLAGRRRRAPTPQWTRARDAARVRALHRDLPGAAADARRGRLADERPRAAPHAAAGLRRTARTAAARIRTCRCGTPS